MDQQLSSCASFAGGFVPVNTEAVVIVTDSADTDIATVKTKAQHAPESPREAISALAEAYGLAVEDVRASVYVVVGGADGKKMN
jgi:voltage-gated potassium channel Kch